MISFAMPQTPVQLTVEEREELETRTRSRSGRSDDARRARLILMLADGASYRTIAESLSCNEHFISTWKKRFLAERLAGLYARHGGRQPSRRTAQMEAKVLALSRHKPNDGPTPWRNRRLGLELETYHT